jgi:hypothetical protein
VTAKKDTWYVSYELPTGSAKPTRRLYSRKTVAFQTEIDAKNFAKARLVDAEQKLRAEWPMILRWMINGCLDWQKNGLVRPDSVIATTQAYFEDQDLLGQWLAGSTGRRKCTSRHNHRLAANKHSSTDPDVRAVTVMLATLRAAVENTVEGRHAAGATCFARPPLDIDRFFAAIISPVRGQAALQPDPDASRRG